MNNNPFSVSGSKRRQDDEDEYASKRVRTLSGQRKFEPLPLFQTCDAIDQGRGNQLPLAELTNIRTYGNTVGLHRGVDYRNDQELCAKIRPILAPNLDLTIDKLIVLCRNPNNYSTLKWIADNVYHLQEGTDYTGIQDLCSVLAEKMERFPLAQLGPDLISYIGSFLGNSEVANLLRTSHAMSTKRDIVENRFIRDFNTRICANEVDCMNYFLHLTLLDQLTPRQKKEYEYYLSSRIIDPNGPIRARAPSDRYDATSRNKHMSHPAMVYRALIGMSRGNEFDYRNPVLSILGTYLGVAGLVGNRDAVELLLQYGALPYPSMESFLFYFNPAVEDILQVIGKTPNISSWDKGMLADEFGFLRDSAPDRANTIMKTLIEKYGYTYSDFGLPDIIRN